MNTFANRPSLFRSTLVAAALAVGIGSMGVTSARADEPAATDQHSDGAAAVISDTAITASVKARYLTDATLKASDIKVSTANGIVTLAGTVASAGDKTNAIELAMGVKGVKSVDAAQLASSGS